MTALQEGILFGFILVSIISTMSQNIIIRTLKEENIRIKSEVELLKNFILIHIGSTNFWESIKGKNVSTPFGKESTGKGI